MGITRDKFLLRHVVFRPSGDKDLLHYKGVHVGWVSPGEYGWSYGFANEDQLGNEHTRHNASEALLDAWIAEHGE